MYTTSLADATAQACPEVQVLLCCVQTCYNPASVEQLPHLLQPDFNMPFVVIRRHQGVIETLCTVRRCSACMRRKVAPWPLHHTFSPELVNVG